MDEHPVILFDGVCNLCNAMVNLVIRNDRSQVFRFASLQSNYAKTVLGLHHQDPIPNSFLLYQNGQMLDRSSAALKVASHMPWYWQWTRLFYIFPRKIRDRLYDWIAANRYRWFGKRETCMVPTAALRSRFLD